MPLVTKDLQGSPDKCLAGPEALHSVALVSSRR